ncbi:MAG: ArsA family ATPase, partial [Gaiellales bacterium]
MTSALFVAGAGGTGKTTVAGALAVAASRTGRQTLVLTVDPALRLGQALGVSHLGNEPVPVPGSRTLSAAMLDAAASWDALVGRHTDADTAARLTSSRFFRAIADRFPAGQAYAVAEETARFVEEGSFETVIVDTPPIGGAVDFFDAPMHIRSLVAGRALRVLTGPRIPGSRIVFAATARPALRLADRVLGGPLLVDLADFLVDLRTTYDGIRDRSRAVQRLLDTSQRIVVATPHRG